MQRARLIGDAVLTRTQVRSAVERAEGRFVEVCVGATDEQWQFSPAEASGDRSWSMPQVVEHVTRSNRNVLRLRDVFAGSPLGDEELDFDDADMPYIFYGGGAASPPLEDLSLAETNRSASVAAFRGSVRDLVEWYDGVDYDLRECAVVHPSFGRFDGAQWVLFLAVHMQQHRGQLLDLKLACDRSATSRLR